MCVCVKCCAGCQNETNSNLHLIAEIVVLNRAPSFESTRKNERDTRDWLATSNVINTPCFVHRIYLKCYLQTPVKLLCTKQRIKSVSERSYIYNGHWCCLPPSLSVSRSISFRPLIHFNDYALWSTAHRRPCNQMAHKTTLRSHTEYKYDMRRAERSS